MTDLPHERPFDVGLQAERTLLAWQRTCLSLAVGNTVAIKYLSELLGLWATAVGIAGVALSVAAWTIARLRYRRAHLGLVRDARLVSSGRLPLLVAASVLTACVAGAAVIVVLWWQR